MRFGDAILRNRSISITVNKERYAYYNESWRSFFGNYCFFET